MRKKLSIINIDGTEGVGKSTQVGMLAKNFSAMGIPVQINHLDDNIESATECAKQTSDFLETNPNGMVLNDGSIARMMVIELNKGINQSKIIEKYREITHLHQCLNHEYGMANILLLMEDLDECHKRLMKRASFVEDEEGVGIVDFQAERYVIAGLKKFDSNIASKNLTFHLINTESDDTIIEVLSDIVEYLEISFPFKKPTSSATSVTS